MITLADFQDMEKAAQEIEREFASFISCPESFTVKHWAHKKVYARAIVSGVSDESLNNIQAKSRLGFTKVNRMAEYAFIDMFMHY